MMALLATDVGLLCGSVSGTTRVVGLVGASVDAIAAAFVHRIDAEREWTGRDWRPGD